jgi:hypothetical protein
MALNWIYKDTDFSETEILDNYGFVYQITNLQTGKKYIGKKFFYSQKTKVVKGKKKKHKIESNWKTYYGSNSELESDVKTLGQDVFKREILYLCKTKGECGYLEAREQFEKKVLESDEYYNSWIMVRVRKNHIKSLIK